MRETKRVNLTALKTIQKHCMDTNCKDCPCYEQYANHSRCMLNGVPFTWDLERIDPDDNY